MAEDVSLIIPVYNRQDLIRRCLESIKNQVRLPKEIIVVDNASSDMTPKVIEDWFEENKELPINFKLISERKRGATFARQKGLENASGKYVVFFDSDDEMLPDLIHEAIEKFDLHPDAEIVCWRCKINLLDGRTVVPPFDCTKPLENHLIHTLLRPQGYMVKRELIINAGGWKKDLPVWNDFEMGFRILMTYPKIIAIEKVLALINAQADSITGTDFSHKQGQWEKSIYEVRKENNLKNHSDRQKVDKILDYRQVILAAHYSREGNKKGARELFTKTMQRADKFNRILLLFAYHYTRFGGRGAWRIIRQFYL